ncbi:hypothetical protein DRJ25_06415, partial [Candidatus Woesearchaeota archaeon]
GHTWYPLDGQLRPRSDSTGRGEPELALDVESICASRDGRIFVATLGQGVSARTPDGTWVGLRRGLMGVSLAATRVTVGGENEESLYAGTQGGVYVLSRPAQRSDKWNRLDNWQDSPAERVRTLFASAETIPRLYVGTQGGFFRSLDGGETWQRATQGIDREVNVIAMAVNPDDVDHLVVSSWDTDGNEKHIYRSTDGGETWQQAGLEFNSVVEDLIFSTVTPQPIYAVTYSGKLYASLDGGVDWQLEDQLTELVLSLFQTDEGKLVVGTDGGGIWIRDPGGEWIPTQVTGAPLTVQSILPFGAELYVGTACCGVFRRDSGGDWQNLSAGLPLQARSISSLAVNDTGTIYAGTYGDGVHARTPGSDGWLMLKDGLPRTAWQVQSLKYLQFESESVLLAGTDDGLYKLRDQRWERVASQEIDEIVDNLLWEPSTETIFATATGGQLYLSHDGGKSWSPDGKSPNRIERLALASSTALQRFVLGSARWTLFAQTEADELYYRTSDEGQWRQVEIDPGQEIVIWSYPHQPGGFLLIRTESNDTHILQQTPPPSNATLVLQRAEWQENILPVDAGILVIATDPDDAKVLYAGTANDGVYRARITLPSLWEQIPADSPIKMALPVVVLLTVLAVLACLLVWRLKRPPKPVELKVEIESIAQTSGYRIQVLGPEQRSNEAVISLPRSLLQFENSRREFFTGQISKEEIVAAGQDLFDFVFGDSALQNIYASSRGRDKRTTLRLRLDVGDELAGLPWEMLRDPHIEQFLALNYSVTRRAKSAERLPEWKPSRRLNILVATASPRELFIPMIDREIEVLREISARSRQVYVDVIEHATPEKLLERLQTN